MGNDLVSNPLLIGLLAGAVTYFYLDWENKKKHKKNPKLQKRKINYLVPIAVGLVVWFLACSYMESEPVQITAPHEQNVVEPNKYKLVRDEDINLSESFGSKSYHMVGKGVKIPGNLPDVLIETY